MKPVDKRIKNRENRRMIVRYGLTTGVKSAFTMNVSVTGIFMQTFQVF